MEPFNHQRGQHIDVAGARIYAETLGPADARTIVLLHGGFGNLEDFNPLLPALDGWRVIGVDSRGHGASTLGADGWTYQRVQEDVEEVLARLGVKRCTVLGFSDGGIVALRLAAARRLGVDRLIVIGATWHAKNLQAVRELLQGVTASSWQQKFPQTVQAYQRMNPEPDLERLTAAVLPGWLDEGPSGQPGETVDAIEVPVLVVRGDDDHLTALADAVELCGRLKQAHFLNIAFAGHVAQADGSEAFLPALARFLRSGEADA